MNLLVTGATGLVGSETVRQAALENTVKEITCILRNPLTESIPKTKTVLHRDFLNYTELEKEFRSADAIIWALGVSQTQVSKQQYETITLGYVMACCQFCLKVNPGIRFVFVSGDGADRTERSRTIFRRIKGKAENALLRSGLKDIIIVRPDAVRPKRKNPRAPLAYKLVYPLFPLVEKFAPHKIIWSDVLGRALVRLALSGYKKNTVDNPELRELGARPF